MKKTRIPIIRSVMFDNWPSKLAVQLPLGTDCFTACLCVVAVGGGWPGTVLIAPLIGVAERRLCQGGMPSGVEQQEQQEAIARARHSRPTIQCVTRSLRQGTPFPPLCAGSRSLTTTHTRGKSGFAFGNYVPGLAPLLGVMTPRTAKKAKEVEARVEAIRSDPTARADLEARVSEYEKADLDAKKRVTAARQTFRPITPRGRAQPIVPCLRPPSSSSSARPVTARPATATDPRLSPHFAKGNVRSCSSLGIAGGDADPVGEWKELQNTNPPPPLKFGFESEGARRRDSIAQTRSPLLGPAEERPGTSRMLRDTEARLALVHSTLPATLRPTPRIGRPRSWQPATRQPAWMGTRFSTDAPRERSTPIPASESRPSSAASLARAAERQTERLLRPRPWPAAERVLQLSTRGNRLPLRMSHRAQVQCAEECDALPAPALQRLVKASGGCPGYSAIGKMSDFERFVVPHDQMRAQRSLISTRLESAHGIASRRLKR